MAIQKKYFRDSTKITLTYLNNIRVFQERMFPEEVEKVKIIPITKPSKETSTDVTKFGLIILMYVGGKVLEKFL